MYGRWGNTWVFVCLFCPTIYRVTTLSFGDSLSWMFFPNSFFFILVISLCLSASRSACLPVSPCFYVSVCLSPDNTSRMDTHVHTQPLKNNIERTNDFLNYFINEGNGIRTILYFYFIFFHPALKQKKNLKNWGKLLSCVYTDHNLIFT